MKTHAQKQSQTTKKSSSGCLTKRANVLEEFRAHTDAAEVADARDRPMPGFAHDFSRIPVVTKAPVRLQAKLTVNPPGDVYERDGDRIAESLKARPEPQLQQPSLGLGSQTLGSIMNDTGEAVRLSLEGSGQERGRHIHAIAERGVEGAGEQLPYLKIIQNSFGHYDVTSVKAHAGGRAAAANRELGSVAFARGNDVAFGVPPILHTAAHEAAHIVQQRAGLHLKGGVGQAGDQYERHADAVADTVTRGESAEKLLDQRPSATRTSPLSEMAIPALRQSSARPVQRQGKGKQPTFAQLVTPSLADAEAALFANISKDLSQNDPVKKALAEYLAGEFLAQRGHGQQSSSSSFKAPLAVPTTLPGAVPRKDGGPFESITATNDPLTKDIVINALYPIMGAVTKTGKGSKLSDWKWKWKCKPTTREQTAGEKEEKRSEFVLEQAQDFFQEKVAKGIAEKVTNKGLSMGVEFAIKQAGKGMVEIYADVLVGIVAGAEVAALVVLVISVAELVAALREEVELPTSRDDAIVAEVKAWIRGKIPPKSITENMGADSLNVAPMAAPTFNR